MEVLGEATVQVSYQNQEKKLPLIIIADEGPRLFGRNWLKHGIGNQSVPFEQLNNLLRGECSNFCLSIL